MGKLKEYEIQINEVIVKVKSTTWIGAFHKAIDQARIPKNKLDEPLHIIIQVVK